MRNPRPDWYGRRARGSDRWMAQASLWHAWASGQVVPPRGFHLEQSPADRWGAAFLLLVVAGAVSALWWVALCR